MAFTLLPLIFKMEEDDTKLLCHKAIDLELKLKEVRITNAFDIHSEFKRCIESHCVGFDMKCPYYQSLYLTKKLS